MKLVRVKPKLNDPNFSEHVWQTYVFANAVKPKAGLLGHNGRKILLQKKSAQLKLNASLMI